MTKPLIPFGWLPGHWGLKGQSRERARAEYELQGFDLDLRLAEIDHPNGIDQELAKLAVQLNHNKISQYDHDVAKVKITESDPQQQEILLAGVDLAHNRISQQQHDRKIADIRQEPWVCMPDIKWDPSDPSRSYFELDYNEHFVTFLRNNNYQGLTDEDIVEKWLNDVCRSVAQELSAEDAGFVAPAPTPTRRRAKKKRSEYS
jgi:hypothetical protein